MGLTFQCRVCGADIVRVFPEPGEVVNCLACGARNVVPGDAVKTAAGIATMRRRELADEARRARSRARGPMGRGEWLAVISFIIGVVVFPMMFFPPLSLYVGIPASLGLWFAVDGLTSRKRGFAIAGLTLLCVFYAAIQITFFLRLLARAFPAGLF
jgi:ribosomal protein S27E